MLEVALQPTFEEVHEVIDAPRRIVNKVTIRSFFILIFFVVK
jgi:hypothetical protein